MTPASALHVIRRLDWLTDHLYFRRLLDTPPSLRYRCDTALDPTCVMSSVFGVDRGDEPALEGDDA